MTGPSLCSDPLGDPTRVYSNNPNTFNDLKITDDSKSIFTSNTTKVFKEPPNPETLRKLYYIMTSVKHIGPIPTNRVKTFPDWSVIGDKASESFIEGLKRALTEHEFYTLSFESVNQCLKDEFEGNIETYFSNII